MTRAALILALCGCAFSQKHPAITAGIVGGVVGGAACEIDNPAHQSTCAYTTAGGALFMGGLTALLLLITNAGDEHFEPEEDSDAVHTSTPPPPGELDAGVEVDAGAAPLADAGVAPVD